MAAQVRAILPQFCGISGSTKTIWSIRIPSPFIKDQVSIMQSRKKFNIKIVKKGIIFLKYTFYLPFICSLAQSTSVLPFFWKILDGFFRKRTGFSEIMCYTIDKNFFAGRDVPVSIKIAFRDCPVFCALFAAVVGGSVVER